MLLDGRNHAALGALLLFTTTLTGCALSEETKPMRTAQEARELMQQFVRDTMDVVGGEWTADADPDGEPIPDRCVLPDGTDGVIFEWNQDHEGSNNPERIVKLVAAMWDARGYTPHFAGGPMSPDGTVYIVQAFGGDVDSIDVSASKYRVMITVDSLCGVGDIDEYEQKYLDKPLNP